MGNLQADGKLVWDYEEEKYQSQQTQLTIRIQNGVNEEVHIKTIKRLLLKETEKSKRLRVWWVLQKTNWRTFVADSQETQILPEIVFLRTVERAQLEQKGTDWILLQENRRWKPAYRIKPNLYWTG